MPDWLGNLLNDVRGIWEKLPASQKWLVGGISTALLVGLIAVTLALYAFPTPELFVGDVPAGERGPIIRYLKDQGVRYQVENGGDIYVYGNAENLYWEYAEQQPAGSIGGYSWLKTSSFGRTRDETDELSRHAQEEVLAQTIVKGNPRIRSAVVFLAPGAEGLFPTTSSKPTASVSITARGKVPRGIVEGIQVLVAGAQPGLEPQDVQVIADGKPVDGFQEQTETEKLTTEQQRAQVVEEQKRKEAIAATLDPIVGGSANYTYSVIVVLDFDRVEIKEKVTDTESAFEKNIRTETINDTTEPVGGTPGTPPNLAGDTLGQGQQVGQVSKLEQEFSEIEQIPSRVVDTHTRVALGKLIQQYVSVTVNHKEDPTSGNLVPREPEEMTSLEQSLKVAVGHIENSTAYRFSLAQMAFDTAAERQVVAQARRDSFRRNLESGAFLVAGLILIAVFFYFLKKVFSIPPEEREVVMEEEIEPPTPEMSLTELGLRALGEDEGLSPEAQKTKVIREQVEDYAAQNPEMVAGILKGWISE